MSVSYSKYVPRYVGEFQVNGNNYLSYLEKIYGSDKDLLSVVFFGTEKQNRSEEFHNVYSLHVNIYMNKFKLNNDKMILLL
jgi:hypothetical protein